MSFGVNSNKSNESNQENDTVEIVPPYHNEIGSFDNPDSYPDCELVVDEKEKTKKLHRKILAQASGKVKAMLDEGRGTKLEWPYDTSDEIDREAMMKALRFCYGETQTVGTKNGECIAMIVALTRLQVSCLDEVVTTLSNFAMEESKRSLEIGVALLKTCVGYKEMSGTNQLTLDKKLAAIVLTKDNMHEHYREVVDECLMVLPPEYLDEVEFGEPHTRWSEFALRMKYVRCHGKKLTKEEKHAMVAQCNMSMLNNQELMELKLTDIIDKDELLEAHEKALEYREIENEQLRVMVRNMEEKVKEIEREKNEETKRAEKEKDEKEKQAELEREKYERAIEVLEKRVETAKKEKDEKEKQAELERERYERTIEVLEKRVETTEKEKVEKIKETEKCMRQIEKFGKEKEDFSQYIQALEYFIKGKRL